MISNLVIISAGQFGREVCAWAEQAIIAGAPYKIKGFIDDNLSALMTYDYPHRIIGSIKDYVPEEGDVFVCAIGNPVTKKLCVERILAAGGEFVNLIHPSAIVGRNVRIGVGVILGPFTSLTCDLVVEDFVTISAFSGCGHDTRISRWTHICGHCGVNGEALIEEGVFLASHVAVSPKSVIGAWAFVGAGSVVLRRVKPHTRVFGVPAMPI